MGPGRIETGKQQAPSLPCAADKIKQAAQTPARDGPHRWAGLGLCALPCHPTAATGCAPLLGPCTRPPHPDSPSDSGTLSAMAQMATWPTPRSVCNHTYACLVAGTTLHILHAWLLGGCSLMACPFAYSRHVPKQGRQAGGATDTWQWEGLLAKCDAALPLPDPSAVGMNAGPNSVPC